MTSRSRSWICCCCWFLLLLQTGCDLLPKEPYQRRCRQHRDCPTTRPVCNQEGRCDRCTGYPTELAEDACKDHGGKLCANEEFDEPGACVVCRAAGDCAAGEGCWFGSCVRACQRHSDCESSVCTWTSFPAAQAPRSTSTAPGLCVPAQSPFDEIIYVNNAAPDCNARGQGTEQNPFCKVHEALVKIKERRQQAAAAQVKPARRGVIKIASSVLAYPAIDLPELGMAAPRETPLLFIGGDSEASRPVVGNAPSGAAVRVGAGDDVLLEGLSLEGSERGLVCDGSGGNAKVRVLRSRIRTASRMGVWAQRCTLGIERSLLSENSDGAIWILDRVGYLITNNFIVKNSTSAGPLLSFDNDAQGIFRFNTVVNNNPGAAGTVDCGGLDRPLQDSIFVSNGLVRSTSSQMSGACQLVNTVVDRSDDVPGGRKGTPRWVDGAPATAYLLRSDDPENFLCCLDRASDLDSSFWTDYFGTARPQGSRADVGAQEVMLPPP